MTIAATSVEIPVAKAAKRITLSLAQKFAIAFLGLVAAVLLINGAIDMALNYRDARVQAVKVQQEKANAAAERVVQFVTEIEQQLGWTTRAEWARVNVEQRRYDFIRLLRQAAAITELVHVDGSAKEQLKLSRLEPDQVGSNVDYAADPRYVATLRDKVYYGPVTFRRGSEPYMTIGLLHAGRNPGATIADVNLKLAWDVVTAIRVGNTGYSFITDPAGRLIAHPDMSLVLRNTDLTALPQVAAARSATPGTQSVADGIGPDGRAVLSANAKVPKVGWNVFVELPAAEALGPVWSALYQTLGLLVLGVALAGLAGTLLARRMVVPITELQAGAQRLGEGDLSSRITVRSGDEIGALAQRFNLMAGQIQESQETLERKVDERTADLNEALEQQTATAEVLKVISRSTFDLQKVLDVLVETVAKLCEADGATLARQIGDEFVRAGMYGFDEAFVEAARRTRFVASRGSVSGRALIEARTIQIADIREDPEYTWTEAKELGRIRTTVGIPLMREQTPIGVISLARFTVRPFTEKQIELLQTFADQAAIAIENARLIGETKEALEQQTATAEVLKVISRSAFDLPTVLRALIASATRLCGAEQGLISFLRDGVLLPEASYGTPPGYLEFMRANPMRPGNESFSGRAALTGEVVNVADALADKDFTFSEAQKRSGYRAMLAVPLKRNGEVIGVFAMPRAAVGAYSKREVELVQTFADQAVIAIENARLLDEVQARTKEVTEALEYQTATSEVLGVISRSPNDLQPVLDTLVASAQRLCAAEDAIIYLRDGDAVIQGAHVGRYPNLPDVRLPLNRRWVTGRAVLDGMTVHVPDFEATEEFPDGKAMALRNGANNRAALASPLMRDGVAIGAILMRRLEPRSFTERQIQLLETFADQAVIAMNNARLFEEVQARTKEVTEALEYQTATSEVLSVISRSPSQVAPVMQTIVDTARQLCAAERAIVWRIEAAEFRPIAFSGMDAERIEQVMAYRLPVGSGSTIGRAAETGRAVQVLDTPAEPGLGPQNLALSRSGNIRTVFAVPLMRDGMAIGGITLSRTVVAPFSDKQIELVETFADQAVIAIENARLFEEVQAKTRDLTASLEDLRTAQDRLVQTEKLASLGQLTAGVAHEIKNPLNFVNNFADLSVELVGEIEEAIISAGSTLDPKIKREVDEIAQMLKGNLAKVVHHGRRADSIVKNMLAHSRESGGERRPVDLNAVVEEALNLAYHGARAEKPGFNITLERDFDPAVGHIEVFPQEFTRVLLNLIGNGFHAANKKRVDGAPEGFEPILRVATKTYPDRIEIKVRDNGTGIPDAVKARIFEPFFTTKPTGEGTGLGLSLSHDIVVKQHGGKLTVDTKPDSFTEFTVILPRIATPPETKT